MASRTRTLTNRTFAENDPLFRKACKLAGVQPTKRQASKWHNGRGRAYANRGQASQAITKEMEPSREFHANQAQAPLR